MDNCRSISTPLCATLEKEGHRNDRPEVSTRCRIDWIWEWRQLRSPELWQFQERVTTNVSNVLQNTCMVILTICNGTHSLGYMQIAAWSRVQPCFACEAELYAGMRGISETLEFVHLMREFKSKAATAGWCKLRQPSFRWTTSGLLSTREDRRTSL